MELIEYSNLRLVADFFEYSDALRSVTHYRNSTRGLPLNSQNCWVRFVINPPRVVCALGAKFVSHIQEHN